METEMDQDWHRVSEQILTDIKEWRRAHPKATFREIEDEPLGSPGAARYGPSQQQSRVEWSHRTGATAVPDL